MDQTVTIKSFHSQKKKQVIFQRQKSQMNT